VLVTIVAFNLDVTHQTLFPVADGEQICCLLLGTSVLFSDNVGKKITNQQLLGLVLKTSLGGYHERIGFLQVLDNIMLFRDASKITLCLI
jgi:hypothetical protein